jgi:hypothetical protein
MELDVTMKSKDTGKDFKEKKKFQEKYYNCQKEEHIARKCPEPKRKRIRAIKAKEL